MDGKNRNTEDIAVFCQKFRVFCDEVTRNASDLKQLAGTAGGALRDEVGQKAVRKVEEFSDELIRIATQGIEPIQELEKKNIQMEEKMSQISGMIR